MSAGFVEVLGQEELVVVVEELDVTTVKESLIVDLFPAASIASTAYVLLVPAVRPLALYVVEVIRV